MKKILIATLAAFVFTVTAPTVILAIDAPQNVIEQQVAYAAEGDEGEVDTVAKNLGIDNDQKKRIINGVVSIQAFINRVIWPVLMFSGIFLDSNILFGSGMEEQLRAIWVPMRNLTNIIFVLILVGIALYNVLGLGEESGNYSLKSILPRIVVGLIAVNFSFLGIKVFLDGVGVMTTAVFALPDQVSEGLAVVVSDDDPGDKQIIKRYCLYIQGENVSADNLKESRGTELKSQSAVVVAQQAARAVGFTGKFDKEWKVEVDEKGVFGTDQILDAVKKMEKAPADIEKQYTDKRNSFYEGRICNGFELTETGKKFISNYNARSAPLAFVLNMSNIVFYEEIDEDLDNLEKITTNVLFSLLLYIIYLASFAALFIVLLARLVVLWLGIVVSPLLVLGYTIPAIKEKIGAFDKINEEFVKNAIAPVSIGLAMTIGWIMLQSIQTTNFETNSLMSTSQWSDLPVKGLSTVQDLMAMVGTVAVVWLGVFTAAENTIAGAVTGTMKSGLQRAAGWAVKTPLNHIPLVPIKLPGDDTADNYSLGQVGRVFTNLGNSQPKNIDELYNKMTGQDKTVSAATIQNAKDPDDFISQSKKLSEGAFKGADMHKSMETWFKRNGNELRKKYHDRGDARQKAAYDAIQKYVKEGGDATKRPDLARALHTALRRIDDPNPTTAAAGNAAGAAAGGAAAGAAGNTGTQTGQTPTPTPTAPAPVKAGDKLGTGQQVVIQDAQVAKINTLRTDAAVQNPTAGNKEDVVKKMRDLGLQKADNSKAEFDINVVHSLIGKEAADKLVATYDATDATKGTQALLDDLNKDGTTSE